jgi:hypothetical protein
MRRLRQKVEVDPNKPVHVQTVRGVGLPADRDHARGAADRCGRCRGRPRPWIGRWLTRRPPTTSRSQHPGRPPGPRSPTGSRPSSRRNATARRRNSWPSRHSPSTPTWMPMPARNRAAA